MAGKIQFCALIFFVFVFSLKVSAHPIDDILFANPEFSSGIVAISVKDADSHEILYQRDANVRVHPASTLKIITSSGVVDYLGSDYQFKTEIYKKRDKVYLKLGADPLFSYQDMSDLASQYKMKNDEPIKTLIIDDAIIDKVPFGIGWQWDDNGNVHFPQISPYIVNRNLFSVRAKLTKKNKVVLEKPKGYTEPLINKLTYATVSNVITERNIFEQTPTITVKGGISSDTEVFIPVRYPQIFYNTVLVYTFMANGVPVSPRFKYSKLPRFSAQQATITHSISDVLKEINSNSNNLAAEILLKHADAARTGISGTTNGGLEVVKNYYLARGLKFDGIQIVDASGVSMNDYVTADFMTNALMIINFAKNSGMIKNSMADGLNGTFKGRLTELNGNLKVKTGTLANTSAVVGFIKTQKGRNLVFSIMLDNFSDDVNPKAFEDKIIKAIYNL